VVMSFSEVISNLLGVVTGYLTKKKQAGRTTKKVEKGKERGGGDSKVHDWGSQGKWGRP